MKPPRGLSPEEAALWRKVAETVTPLHPARRAPPPSPDAADTPVPTPPAPVRKAKGRATAPARSGSGSRSPPPTRNGLDSSWDRKLARGTIDPDVTIDLHGMGLDAAHGRLVNGVGQALAMGARVILLVAGKHRPRDDHGFTAPTDAANGAGRSAPACSTGWRPALCRQDRRRPPRATAPRRQRRGLYRPAPRAVRPWPVRFGSQASAARTTRS
jgi:DNA-nicking Smr family endonuclease